MSELTTEGFGASLRRRREELGLSLDDVAASTRIRKTYLQALEDENLQALPGGTYAVGFLRIYAGQLGLPVEPLLAAIDDGDTLPEGSERPAAGRSSRRRLQKVKRDGGRGRRIVVLLVLLVASAAAYLSIKVSVPTGPPPPVPPAAETIKSPAAPAAPAAVAVPAASPPAAPVAGPGEAPPASVEFTVIPPGGAVVRMLTTGNGMAKVSLDQQEVREYPLLPEQTLHWKVSHSLAVECSTPGLLRLWVDQQEVPVAELAAFILVRAPAPAVRP
jgi:cytoskeleton protein RodZ